MNDQIIIPEVGMGCTEYLWSDSYAYTIVRVSKSGKTFWAQRDKATRTDSNGMSDCQSYDYEPNTDAPLVRVSLRKNGYWKRSNASSTFGLGHRHRYHDYSF